MRVVAGGELGSPPRLEVGGEFGSPRRMEACEWLLGMRRWHGSVELSLGQPWLDIGGVRGVVSRLDSGKCRTID
jgi:hypothetical protein